MHGAPLALEGGRRVGLAALPAFARTSSQCAGMITKKTFATMIVPSIAPIWIAVPRPENSSLSP